MLVRFLQMLASWRLMLVLAVAPALLLLPTAGLGTTAVAFAQDDDDWGDEDDEDEDDGFGDDGFEDDGFGEDEPEEDAGPQPPVTAGGLFTKRTYPISELQRPLTVTKGMFEVRGGIQIDVSDQTAFETFRFQADARYGLQDHVELQALADFKLAGDNVAGGSLAQFGLGFEGGLYYDVVHFRAVAVLPINTKADNVDESEVGFDTIIGLPFRYRINDKLAIVALDEIMTLHFTGDDKKPDLTIGIGGVYQVIENVALFARAELFVPRFDSEQLTAPVTIAAQFSPTNLIDLGLEFFLPIDISQSDMQDIEIDRFRNRFVLLFGQLRL